MEILFLCSEYPPAPFGGIGAFTQSLARGLSEKGHGVTILGSYDVSMPESDGLVRIHSLPRGRGRIGMLRERARIFAEAKGLAQGGRIDIVEATDWGGPVAFWPKLPVPVVSRIHGSASYFRKELGRQPEILSLFFERASVRRSDALCSVSRYAYEASAVLFGLRPDGLRTILANPVEMADQIPAFESRHVGRVVFLGTLTPKKGIFSLLAAWPEVVRRVPEARLEIFGKDTVSTTGASTRAALEAGLPESFRGSVSFHGHVSRMEARDQLLRARVGVFPSFSETFGMVAAESMAAGCPTVFTRRSCGPEILRHGEEGLLVDPGNPLEIAEAVTTMLRDDNLARKFSYAAHVRAAREYRLEEVVRRNEDFYREVVNGFAPIRIR